jgi:hypothetical protein
MVWSQYSDEANLINRDTHQISEEADDLGLYSNVQLTLADWITWHSTDLMNMWRSLRTYIDDACIGHDILNDMDYADFCQVCYNHSSKFPSKNSA